MYCSDSVLAFCYFSYSYDIANIEVYIAISYKYKMMLN